MVMNLNIVTAKAREWRSRYSLCFMGEWGGVGWMERTINGVESLEK
jgi:hypothetical protein